MKYKKAPIQEAIFDIRTNQFTGSSLDEIENLHEEFSDIYPNKSKIFNYFGKLEFKEASQLKNESGSELKGYLFSNKENNRKVQARFDGFTFNMLKPYTEWNEFSKEALRLWDIYKSLLKPEIIKRIALRFINRIEIPTPFDSFNDFILNMPQIPVNLPQKINNFFMQVEVPAQKEINTVVTETIEKPEKNFLPFILDVDVYKYKNINDDLNQEFDKLRKIKNETFESCITDKARGLFS